MTHSPTASVPTVQSVECDHRDGRRSWPRHPPGIEPDEVPNQKPRRDATLRIRKKVCWTIFSGHTWFTLHREAGRSDPIPMANPDVGTMFRGWMPMLLPVVLGSKTDDKLIWRSHVYPEARQQFLLPSFIDEVLGVVRDEEVGVTGVVA